MKVLFAACLALTLGTSLSAFAQQAAPPAPRVGQACKSDAQAFCPNMGPGPQRHQCMMTNLSKMSPDCQVAFNAMEANMKTLWQACGADFRQYCKGATAPAQHRQCVEQNQGQFSSACQAVLSKQLTPASAQQ